MYYSTHTHTHTCACALVGCGTGNCTVALSPYFGTVNGLEHSKGMLQKAQEKTKHLTNVELQQGDITNMPFLDSYFDGIVINQVNETYIYEFASSPGSPSLLCNNSMYDL